MSEIIADAMRQYMVGSITTGADLLQIRHMVGLTKSHLPNSLVNRPAQS